jgi:hypothetical protein
VDSIRRRRAEILSRLATGTSVATRRFSVRRSREGDAMAQPQDLERAAAALASPARRGAPWAAANAALLQLILRYSAAGYSRRSILTAIAKAKKSDSANRKTGVRSPSREI